MLSHTTMSKLLLGICTQGKIIEKRSYEVLTPYLENTWSLDIKPINIGATESPRILEICVKK